jgi:hypothetical protein
MLDLDGTPPPARPHTRSHVMAFRAPADLAAWIRDEAERDHVSHGTVIRHIICEARQQGRWPDDVHRWLLAQAACLGTPGDLDNALISVVRHLAVRWPHGARLHQT